MTNRRPGGVTFADVWHSPALPDPEFDYRLRADIPDDIEGHTKNLGQQWDETASKDLKVGDLVTDTAKVMNDDLYGLGLAIAHARHAHVVASERRPLLFSETLGVEVGVHNDDNYNLAGVMITDKDFTDDQFEKLRRLEAVDTATKIPRVLAQQLQRAGLELHIPVAAWSDSTLIAEHLQEALDPAVLSADELLEVVTQYGRQATAYAVHYQEKYAWLYSGFTQDITEQAADHIGRQAPELFRRRIGLHAIYQFDYLAEILTDTPFIPKLDPNEQSFAQLLSSERQIHANVLNRDPDVWAHAHYHEGTHMAGATTWEVVEKPINADVSLEPAVFGSIIIDPEKKKHHGIKSNEALTEIEARQTLARQIPSDEFTSRGYADLVRGFEAIGSRRPDLTQVSTGIFYAGAQSRKDIDTLRTLSEEFDNAINEITLSEM